MTIVDLAFQQTGAGTFVPTAAGLGTFAIPGLAIAVYDDAQLFLAGLVPVPIFSGTSSNTSPISLTGSYKVTGPPGDTTLELDVVGNYQFELFSSTHPTYFDYVIGAPLAVTVSGSVALNLVTDYGVRLHLEQSGIVVPEPEGIGLLFVGLATLSIFVWCRRFRPDVRGAKLEIKRYAPPPEFV